MEGSRDRIDRHTSIPLPSGSRASSTATCGRSAGMIRSASFADPLSPTTTRSSSDSNRSRRPCRTISWSSSRKIRVRPPRADPPRRDSAFTRSTRPEITCSGADRRGPGYGHRAPTGSAPRCVHSPGSSSGLAAALDHAPHEHGPAGARAEIELVHLEGHPAGVRSSARAPYGEVRKMIDPSAQHVGHRQDLRSVGGVPADPADGARLHQGEALGRRERAEPPLRCISRGPWLRPSYPVAARSSRGPRACPPGARRCRRGAGPAGTAAHAFTALAPGGVRLALLIASITR